MKLSEYPKIYSDDGPVSAHASLPLEYESFADVQSEMIIFYNCRFTKNFGPWAEDQKCEVIIIDHALSGISERTVEALDDGTDLAFCFFKYKPVWHL
jgi:hypothetical protein